MSRSNHIAVKGPEGYVYSNRSHLVRDSPSDSLAKVEKKVNKALKFGMSRDSPFLKHTSEVHPSTKSLLDNRKAMFSRLVNEGGKSPEM